jgi:hypothetical protein
MTGLSDVMAGIAIVAMILAIIAAIANALLWEAGAGGIFGLGG